MKKTYRFGLSLLATLTLSTSYAIPLENTTAKAFVNITNPQKNTNGFKEIRLMKMNIDQIKNSKQYSQLQTRVLSTNDLPPSIDLGMNKVPVLDQGMHGSCVTFAVTGALNALIGKGDYISQLCNLELGDYLSKHGYMLSGWNGSFGPAILDQLYRFGYVSQEKQKSKGCAGVYEYPRDSEYDEGTAISLDEYSKLQENLINSAAFPKWVWIPIMNVFDRFNSFDRAAKRFTNTKDAEAALLQVKSSLAKGNRVTVGTLIVTSTKCGNITCGTNKVKNDSWVATASMLDSSYARILGGHEMVFTGYDDDKTATDNEGGKHKGILTLRNSWGTDVGDKGDFYMSYDYFINYVDELNRIEFDSN